MKFFVNDHCFETSFPFTLFDLVTYLNLKQQPIAIEKNNLFIPKIDWLNTKIINLDKIEIVTIVGGG